MRISTRMRYGTRALLELAMSGETLSITTMAGRQGLSVKYLEQIMRSLRKAGIVTSTAGVRGGYALARPPESIHLDDVYLAIEGTLSLVDCVEKRTSCSKSPSCPTLRVWAHLTHTIGDTLHGFTIADLLKNPDKGTPPAAL